MVIIELIYWDGRLPGCRQAIIDRCCFEKLALSARRATRRQTLRSFGDVAWGFLLDQKHGRIDHAYCPNDFRQGRARASKEGRTELERELRAVDDSTPWLSFGETAEVE